MPGVCAVQVHPFALCPMHGHAPDSGNDPSHGDNRRHGNGPLFGMPAQELDGLLERAVAGDAAAHDLLWTKVAAELRRLVKQSLRGVVRTREQTEDVVQEVLGQLYLRLDRLHNGEHLKRSLQHYVSHKVADLYQRHVRKRRDSRREQALPSTDSDGSDLDVQSSKTLPPAAAARAEEHEALRLALQSLRASDRQLVQWRDFDKSSWSKIADRLGVAEDTARQRYRRAIQELNAMLRRRGGSDT